MSASVPIATGRYMLAVARGEKPMPPGPFAYDLGRWVFVEDRAGSLVCRPELSNDEEREVHDFLVARTARRSRA